MPPRSKSQKERRANILTRAIPAIHIMPTPCSYCRTRNLVCRVNLKSGRCYECVRKAQKCSLLVTKKEFDRLAKLREKAKSDLEKAENDEERMAAKLHKQQEELRV
jgi:hypothetical protein